MSGPDDAFTRAVAVVLAHEGGLADDPRDPGGITKYGIALASYPALGPDGIRALTLDQAAAIYRRDWWNRYGYGAFDPAIGAKLLDLAVNVGASAAHRCLQRALRACGMDVVEDGVLGPATRQAVAAIAADRLMPALRSEAAGHYRLLVSARPADRAFEDGWLVRAYS